jgi:hypothetical protein
MTRQLTHQRPRGSHIFAMVVCGISCLMTAGCSPDKPVTKTPSPDEVAATEKKKEQAREDAVKRRIRELANRSSADTEWDAIINRQRKAPWYTVEIQRALIANKGKPIVVKAQLSDAILIEGKTHLVCMDYRWFRDDGFSSDVVILAAVEDKLLQRLTAAAKDESTYPDPIALVFVPERVTVRVGRNVGAEGEYITESDDLPRTADAQVVEGFLESSVVVQGRGLDGVYLGDLIPYGLW